MTEVGALAEEGAVVTVGGVATAVVIAATSGGVVGISMAEADVVADGAVGTTSEDEDGWRLGEREQTGVPGWESVSEEDEAALSVVGVGAAAVTTLAVAKVVDSLGVDSISGSR